MDCAAFRWVGCLEAEKLVCDSGFGFCNSKVDRVFRFEDVVEAYRHLESNQQIGKIVITL
jgi:NADPH:quinone reductase-like Zn-dependent oxidoreductase